MKKGLIRILLGFAILATVGAVGAGIVWKLLRPQLTVPPLIDFGVVQPGSVECSVRIENWSFKPITVTEVRSNCGCTVVDLPTRATLRFGESTTFHVALDVKDASGPVEKQLLVLTDRPGDEGTLIPVHALVDRSLKPRLVPAHWDVGSFGAWERPEKLIRLDYTGPGDLKPHLSQRLESGLQLALIGHDGQSILYRLQLSQELPLGPFEFRVPIDTERGVVTLQLTGDRRGSVYCCDDFLAVPGANLPAIRKELRLRFDPVLDLARVSLHASTGSIRDMDVRFRAKDECSVFFTYVPRLPVASGDRDYIDVVVPGNHKDTSLRVPMLFLAERA